MRKLCLPVLLCTLSMPLSAVSVAAGIDAASLMSFAYGSTGIRCGASLSPDENFRLNLGFGYYASHSQDNDIRFLNTFLSADYFIFPQWGIYIGVTVADVFFPFGLDSDGQVRFSNHMKVGICYDFPFFSADASVILRDLSGSDGTASNYLSEEIRQLERVSFSLMLSFRYDRE